MDLCGVLGLIVKAVDPNSQDVLGDEVWARDRANTIFASILLQGRQRSVLAASSCYHLSHACVHGMVIIRLLISLPSNYPQSRQTTAMAEESLLSQLFIRNYKQQAI